MLLMSIVAGVAGSSSRNDGQAGSERIFGQTPPGLEPVKFLPEVLTRPVPLGGAVNTSAFERFPSLSRDGKYLFFIRSSGQQFVSDQAHFYWVDARSIEGIKPKLEEGPTSVDR